MSFSKGLKRFLSAATVCVSLLIGTMGFAAELKVGMVSDIRTMDPQKFNDIITANVTKQIYNNLVKTDQNMKIVPDLALKWENPSDKVWIFHLRKGVFFHNGEEFTAKDVKFTFDRIMDPDTASPGVTHVRQVASVEVLDKYKVKITTKTPFAPLPYSLARYELAILNEKAVKAGKNNYGQNPVGTGPFKFVKWIRGDRVILEKNPKYFEGVPKLDRVVFRGIPEDATRLIELESGGIDLIPSNAPAQEYLRLKDSKKFKAYSVTSQSTQYVFYNMKVKPFNNKLVRQALNYAVDKKAIVDAVYFGIGAPSTGPMAPVIWGYDKSLKREPYPYDPKKAKELLKKAGFPNGFKCTLYSDTRTQRKNVSELVQAYLSQVGVEVKIELLERGAFLSAGSKGVNGMGLSGWVGTGDADGALMPIYHTSGIGSVNYSQWSDKVLDAMLEQGQASLDSKKRLEIYKKAQRYIIDEAPQLFLILENTLALSRSNVQGFKPYPNQIAPLFNVSLK